MKQFVTKYMNIIPDSMDYVYVLIKLDLDLLNTCRRAKQGLLESLRNPELFSREWIAAFSDESFTPLESDSKRIVDLKKIIRGLTQLEQCLEHLDDLHDILDLGGNDRNRVLFSIRLMSILGPATYLMTDVLGMFHAIQQSPNAIDVLLGESVTPLMSQLNRLFLSIHASDLAGASSTWMPVAMSWFKMGEVHSDNPGLVQLSKVIFRLPDYLHDLQQWLDPTPANEASTHVEPSAHRKSQSDAFFKSLERLSTSNSAPILSLIVAIRVLLDHLPSVLNAAGPLSETMYLKTEEVLNQLRHVYFPEILAELESLEERLSLRPNTLVEPTFGAMQSLYDAIYTLPSTLEQTSSHLKTVADGLSSKSLKVARRLLGNKDAIQIKKIDGSDRLRLMQDEEFSNRLNSMRLARYATAYERSMDDKTLKAIDAFFHTASLCSIPYLYFFPSSLVQSVTMLSEWSDRLMNPKVNELVEKYQQIQPYYAALYPRMDVLFVTDLSAWLKKNASLLQADAMRSSIRTFAKQEQNQYKLICSYIESNQVVRDGFYVDKMQQAQSSSIVESPSSVRSPEVMQLSPRSESLKTSSDDGDSKSSFSFSSVGSSLDSEETPVLLTFGERIADIQQRVQEKRHIHSALEELRTLGDQPRYKPWLDQVFSMQPADSLERFIQQDFKTWASTHLDEAVYQELTFEPSDISASVVCNGEVLMHQNTPVVMLYRKMLFVLNALQKNLRTIEKAYNTMKAKEDADPFRANYRWDFLRLLLTLDLSYLACFISDIQQSPVLHEWMQQALTSLTPLEGIPMIGEVIQSIKAPFLTDNAAIDVVARWQYEKKRVQYTLEGWPLMDDLLTRKRGVGMDEPNIETKACDAASTPLNHKTAFAPVLAERLHQLSAALRRIHASTAGAHIPIDLDEKITSLFAHVSGTGWNRKTLSSIVSLVAELTNILVGLHEEAKVASLIALRQVCAKLGAELISLTDEAEFQLCFESGVLSNECAEVFYQFYWDLGIALPISYNEKMQWIDSLPLMLHRVSIAQKRLNDAELSQRADIRADELVLNDQYAILSNMKSDSTMASLDFNRLDQQEKLLRVYQLLQPYVYAINPTYDLSYFLRTLKKSSDFEALYERLQSMKGSLFQLVEQKKIYYAQMMEKRHSHFVILKEHAIKEQRRAGLKKDFLIHMYSNFALKAMPRELDQQLSRFIEKNLTLSKRNLLTRFQKMVKGQNALKTESVKLAFISLDEVNDAFLSMVSFWGAPYIRARIQRDLENKQSQTLLRSGFTQALVQQCVQTEIAVYGTWVDQCCAINQEIAVIADADDSTSPYAKIQSSDLEQMKAYLFQQDLSPEARVLGSGLDCYYDLRKIEQLFQASSLAIELASCTRISEDIIVKVQTKINNIKALLCNNDLNMADRLQKIVEYCLKEDTVQAIDAFCTQTSGGISNAFFKSSPDHEVKAFLMEIDAISKKTCSLNVSFSAAIGW